MTTARDPGVDLFRGLTIMMMVVVNYLQHIRVVPWWLKHRVDIGITVVDFIAPFFIVAIGLTFGQSVRRRRDRDGWRKTIEHVAKRALALVGMGALFSIGEIGFGFNTGGYPWGTLQAIGVAILLSFPFLFLPWPARLAAALGGAVGYQLLLDAFWLERVLSAPQAGLPGTLSWTVILVLATVFADLADRRRIAGLLVLAAAILAAGLALAAVIPVSKHRMSLSFDLIVTGAGGLASVFFRWVARHNPPGSRVLTAWGSNPLVLYLTHLFLLAVFLVPEAPRWHVDAPIWQVVVQGLVFVALLQGWAWWLWKRGVRVSL